MLIIGVNDRDKKIDGGTFFCPHCQQKRPYTHRRRRRYFSLFFIPLIPLNEGQTYIACNHCNHHYKESVLHNQPPMAVAARAPQTRRDLLAGMPLDMARQKLINEGYDAAFATEVTAYAAGDTHTCPHCERRYVTAVQKCTHCGRKLG